MNTKLLIIKQEFYPALTAEEGVVFSKNDKIPFNTLEKLGFIMSDFYECDGERIYWYGEHHNKYDPQSFQEIEFDWKDINSQFFSYPEFYEDIDLDDYGYRSDFDITDEGQKWLKEYFKKLLSLSEDEIIHEVVLLVDQRRYHQVENIRIYSNKNLYILDLYELF